MSSALLGSAAGQATTGLNPASQEGVDVAPNSARVYDYLLGGGYNFAPDRKLAAQLEKVTPGARTVAHLNRAFLRRAVLFLVNAGVRQFLDLGSGFSTVGNVHEIAQQADDEVRVVYVDKEPIAVAHAELLLAGNLHAGVVRADLQEPDVVLQAAASCDLLDFDAPIGLLAFSALQWVPERRGPHHIVASYRDRLATGSYLVLSHSSADAQPDRVAATVEVFKRSADELHPRSRKEILRMFTGFELLAPGLVTPADWHPESPTSPRADAGPSELLVGVGRKPRPPQAAAQARRSANPLTRSPAPSARLRSITRAGATSRR